MAVSGSRGVEVNCQPSALPESSKHIFFRGGGVLVLLLALLVSLALNYAYLFSGFQADDLIFLRMRQADPLPFSRWAGVWSAPVESYQGFKSLWWLEPDVSGAFFRPLPSLLIEGSVELFGEDAFPLHLCSVLLHGAVGFTVFALFVRLSGSRALGLLSALVYLTCEDHSMGVGWIATITDILCVLFANAALLAHLSYRRGRQLKYLVLSLGLLGLAFTCKESAAIAPLAIVALEFVLPASLPAAPNELAPIDFRGRLRRWLRRYPYWLPAAVVMAIYLVLYRLGGFGMHSLMYHDPFGQPAAYFQNVALGLPVMVLAAVTPVMPSFVMFLPESGLYLAVAGTVVLALLAWGLRPVSREPVTAYGLIMFTVALLPQLATVPSERLLYFPLVFGSYVVARLVAEARPLAQRMWPQRTSRAPLITRLWGWSLALGMVLPGLVLSAYYPHMFGPSLDAPRREVSTAVELVASRQPERVLFVTTSGMFVTFYVGDLLQHLVEQTIPVHVLSSAQAKMSIERLSDRSFVLRADRESWLSNMFASIVRTDPILARGRVYRQPGFTATLSELTPNRRDALAVQFDFEASLERDAQLLLRWDEQAKRFVELDFQSLRDGESRALTDTSDLMKLMGM